MNIDLTIQGDGLATWFVEGQKRAYPSKLSLHPPDIFSQLGSGSSLPQKGTLQDLEDRTKGKQSCFVGLCEPAGGHQYDRRVILLTSWNLIL